MDALDEDNRTPLIICSKFDIRMGTEIAEMLLKAKADVACAGDKSLTKYDGRTALHFASQHANLDIIRLLIHNGANKDAQDSLVSVSCKAILTLYNSQLKKKIYFQNKITKEKKIIFLIL